MTIAQALRNARTSIDAVDARVLLRHALGVTNEYLATHTEQPLSPEQIHLFQTLVESRQQGEPVAYLTGTREFYGLELKVTPAVLIPRPETELLVELALERIPENQPSTALDLGTGSGAIAIALAHYRRIARITATDASNAALTIAAENIEKLLTSDGSTDSSLLKNFGDASPIELLWSDWYTALQSRQFDIIVSNPPYIATMDSHLSEGDVRFEPQTALTSGPDGLNALRHIIYHAPAYLHTGGWLLCEHGYDQAERVQALFTEVGFTKVFSAQDLAGIPRATGGQLGSISCPPQKD
ncbi:MAG: peptide chain release factor N(5)-glutamine methyltransferase [Pseudomonadota bacterium]